MASWWERFPGRLEAELEAFRERGLEFELDEAMFRGSGRVLLRGTIEFEGEQVRLEVLYPDLFPYLRPEVYAPELKLERHQNPRDHNLCLLDRASRFWQPSNTGAWLVSERVPELLSLFKQGPEAMASAEAPQGEPASVYFGGVTGAAVFVPTEALELSPEHRFGSGRLSLAPEAAARSVLRGLLRELVIKPRAKKTTRVAGADDALLARFGGPELAIRWVRLDAPPEGFDAEALFAAADDVADGLGRPPWQQVGNADVAIVGVVFREEVRQSEYEDAWVFGVRVRQRTAEGRTGSYATRGERLTAADYGARIPRLAELRNQTVSLAGLGALGAPLALELARNQTGRLRLLEHDHLEAGQTVRYPFGVTAVGHEKLAVVAGFIAANYPFTALEQFPHRLGQTAIDRHGRDENEFDLLDRFLAGSDLVIDATAEIGVQHLVSDLARSVGVTQLYISATEGARGGQIARIVPGAGGCWHCWKRHAGERTIPLPPFEEGGTIQPRGCASPTFTGASFDLLPIIAQSARVATSTLLAEPGASRSIVWVCDVPADGIGAPLWSEHAIEVHAECEQCAAEL